MMFDDSLEGSLVWGRHRGSELMVMPPHSTKPSLIYQCT